MNRDCSIVRDLLPLYLEKMVSEDTAQFVAQHLETCADCRAEFESLKTDGKPGEMPDEQRESDAAALVTLKKKLRKRNCLAAGITAVCLLAVIVLLYLFPVYRLAKITYTFDVYNWDELSMLTYIGSPSDRAQAQSVLRLADQAFRSCLLPREANQERYGLLSRYATDYDSYPSAVSTTYSLQLWSAHLEETDGWLWVYYSVRAYDRNGNLVWGTGPGPSLWRVAKDDTNTWTVVEIIEHP